MNIDPKRLYRPKEIAKNLFIPNSRGKSDYHFVLRLIRRGKLPARNYGTDSYPLFQVKGEDVIRYNEGYYEKSGFNKSS